MYGVYATASAIGGRRLAGAPHDARHDRQDDRREREQHVEGRRHHVVERATAPRRGDREGRADRDGEQHHDRRADERRAGTGQDP